MKYHYYINDVEVFPKGEWSIEYQRNDGQIFFRRIFEGELTFGGADYDFITSLDCEIATFDLYCGGQLDWEGQFQYPYKTKFDDDSCVVVLTPEVVDEYTCIMNGYGTPFELSVTAAALAVQLRTCAGVLQTTFNLTYRLYDWLDEAINDAVNGLNCGLTLSSSFMWRDNFANGDNYAAAYGTNNYITGAGNRLEYIYLARNTYVRGVLGASLCDGLNEPTFKDWETFLRNAFNAYWFIDENGDFRIEHISYFDPAFAHSDYTADYDLTTIYDKGRSYAYRRNKYEYETGRMYDQERWTWQHYEGTEGTIAHGADFEGVPIFYGAAINRKSDYVPGDFKEKEFACPEYWADISWAFQLVAAGTASTIKCPGFLMLDVNTATNWVRCETGVLSAANQINGHLSTANLQDHYHTYDRIFLEGDMNSGDVTTFETAQKHKLQEAIEFPLCCDESFDPLNRIKTELGDGEVKAAVQKKQSIEVELWHEFDC